MTSITTGRTEIFGRLIAPVLLIAALIFPLTTTEAGQGRQKQRRAAREARATGSTQGTAAQQSSTDQTQRTGPGRRGRRGRTGAINSSASAQGGNSAVNQQTQSAVSEETGSTQSTMVRQGPAEQTQTSRRVTRGRSGDGRRIHVQKVVRQVNQATLTAAQIDSLRRIPGVLSVVAITGNTIKPLEGKSIWELTNGGHLVLGSVPTPNAMQVYKERFPDGSTQYVACFCPNSSGSDPCEFDDISDPNSACRNATCCKKQWFVIEADGTVRM